MKEKIVRLAQQSSPELSAQQIADAVGCKRQYVYKVLKEAGVELKSASRFSAMAGGPEKLPTATVSHIAELYVVSDLLKRGYVVFESVIPTSHCDVICFHEMTAQNLIKIKVKAASLTSQGWAQYSAPAGDKSYDCLALVLPSGEISYRPKGIIPDQNPISKA